MTCSHESSGIWSAGREALCVLLERLATFFHPVRCNLPKTASYTAVCHSGRQNGCVYRDSLKSGVFYCTVANALFIGRVAKGVDLSVYNTEFAGIAFTRGFPCRLGFLRRFGHVGASGQAGGEDHIRRLQTLPDSTRHFISC